MSCYLFHHIFWIKPIMPISCFQSWRNGSTKRDFGSSNGTIAEPNGLLRTLISLIIWNELKDWRNGRIVWGSKERRWKIKRVSGEKLFRSKGHEIINSSSQEIPKLAVAKISRWGELWVVAKFIPVESRQIRSSTGPKS